MVFLCYNLIMKSGFVVLAGRSNVGKSTLLNALVGSKVAIVTPKPQTTRRPVRGILHDARGQIVFVDTPGIFMGKKDPLSRRLNDIVREQLDGIDAIVYVMDPTRKPGPEEETIQRLLRKLTTPIIVFVNKNDLPDEEARFRTEVRATDIGQRMMVEGSAATHQHIQKLTDALFALLPEGEAYYPEKQLTDMSNTEWLGELIREKVFLHLREEIPYSTHVEVTDVQKRGDTQYVAATIWTTEDRYKGMIIGTKAQMLKSIGADARKELEMATNQNAFLDLIVDVDPKWQQRFT
ncbi:GTPase Era [Candidatus Uhrbacteria bacterium]|nr:GTPase Era [Candidatus Uhrbacteria bacterium]